MLTLNSSLLSENELNELFDLPTLDRRIESACRVAIQHPRSLYVFMQRYAHFNGYAGSLVARLASSVGLSRDLFNDSENPVIDEADRGMEIAGKILAATLDEHADQGQHGVPHRVLAQATLKSIGNYANLDVEEKNKFAVIPDWLEEILQRTVQGYQGTPGNIAELVIAMGFHCASEILASHEYSVIDTVIRHENRGSGFDAYLNQISGKVELNERRLSAWCWIVIHGSHKGTGVEAEHFEFALEALNLTAQYRSESRQQIRDWALKGFLNFVSIQQKLFEMIDYECNDLLEKLGTSASSSTPNVLF
jgi:hypothetical protein